MSAVITRHHYDAGERLFYAERIQDVEPIIEANKRRQNEQQNSKHWRHVAEIPNVFIEKWLNEEHARGNVGLKLFGEEFDRMVERKLKDPDYRWLRTD